MRKIMRILRPLLFLIVLNSLNGQGNCLNFTSNSDRFTIPAQVNASDDFTLEAWFYSNNVGTGSNIGRLFVWGASGTRFEVGDWAGGNFVTYVYGGGGGSSYINSGVYIRDGNWHHVAFTRDGNQFKVYIDGNLTNTFNRNLIMNSALKVGHFSSGNPSNSQWIGDIDEIRLWDTPLSQIQIQTTMNTELIGNETGLVGYWNFNQGVAGGNNAGVTTLNDLHSNNNDGTLINFSLNGSTSNWIGSGAEILNCTSSNTFLGTIDSDWDNPSNWSKNCVPTSPISGEITINGNCTISNVGDFQFESGSLLSINSGVTLTNNGTGTWNMNGTIINNGTYTKSILTNEGTYKGSGTFLGNFVNNGVLSPGGN